ncbi:unnamed protein product [Didymodactylos carnosus]|uniref:Uncharacterized protein n=1 Tax=Didymodactylos carnosus TaxID=1234261 RepID=A0A814M960_9BILA|nr:unnamed protein product [Didymodactylos carnosus]CAF3842657.1 unnamed protein product [Didymodactylos carnosus]
MTSLWSLLSLLLFVIFNIVQITPVLMVDGSNDQDSLNPLLSVTDGIDAIDDVNSSNQQQNIGHIIKNIIQETDPIVQNLLLNQLREDLNRMCIQGHFGSTMAHACKHILSHTVQQQLSPLMREYQHKQQHNDDDIDSTTQTKQLQKRFFCNGFIGCKHGGR